MASIPSIKEIQEEINKLKEIKPHVLMYSSFGDNHHEAIEAQIQVLEEIMEEDDIEDAFDDKPENVRSAAMDAAFWLAGEEIDDFTTPSESWKELVRN